MTDTSDMTLRRGLAPGPMSPVLVGRDDVLALALRRWLGAVGGTGHLLLIAGEAGIGKTRILRELSERVGDARTITASAFPRECDAVGGMLANLADDLARCGHGESASELRDRLAVETGHGLDSARHSRLLVGDLARILEGALVGPPSLLLVEDAHWSDEVSLEALARLVRAIRSSSLLVVVTYRSDEAVAGSPLAIWRARLLAQRQAEEVRLERLGREGVSDMAHAIMGAPPSLALVDVLLERSDGIPLHVEELLASGAESVPDSVAEAVHARTQRLSADAHTTLLAASVIGRSFDIDLLASITQASPERVECALRALADEHLVVGDPFGDAFVFRHALLCDAVYRTIPTRRRREWHSAVAHESLRRGLAEATVSDHFERAGELDEAYRHALAGARDASQRSAHREAAALYRRALLTGAAALAPRERARLRAELAAELLASDDSREAAEHLAEAIMVFRDHGDEMSAAALVPDLMSARHLLGAGLEERAGLANSALARLEGLAPAGAATRGALLAALAAAYMLDRRLEDASQVGAEAESVLATVGASAAGPDPVSVSLDATLGSVLVFGGQGVEGWSRLESAIRAAEDGHLEREAARAYRMIGSSASALLDYRRAERWLARGIAYTAQVERWNDHHYLVAHHAHVRWAVGDWAGAEDLARRAMAAGDGITTRITALQVLGYIALGRGQWPEARQFLQQSHTLAERMGELQRVAPSQWGLAELALAQHDAVTAVALCERALAASLEVDDAAYLFPFVVTGTRAHLATTGPAQAASWIGRCASPIHRRALPGTLAAMDHSEGIVATALGEHDRARTALLSAQSQWAMSDRWWEGAWSLVDLARTALTTHHDADAAAATSTARERADVVGAQPLARAAAALEHQFLPSPLSTREWDVARLIASGATNRLIAEKLVIAPKTVSAHVEHILAKLGASRRAEIAAWVARAEVSAS